MKIGSIEKIQRGALIAGKSGVRPDFVRERRGKIMTKLTEIISRRVTGIVAALLLIVFPVVISAEAAQNSPSLPAFSADGFVPPSENVEAKIELRDPDSVIRDRTVYAGGMPFGVKLYTDGLIIIGFSDVDSKDGASAPAKDAGMQVNDIIIAANGKDVESAQDFIEIVENSGGKPIQVIYLRGNARKEGSITPSVSQTDGKYRTGMWLRDSTAGIGTVTFILPESGVFAGLGHGICDSETGMRVPLSRGITSNVKINGVKKGTPGTPGELQGSFTGDKTGNLFSNTDNGVFGIFTETNFTGEKFPLGRKCELTEGDAYIICTLDDSGARKYSVRISDIHPDSTGNKNFLVTVTDDSLIEKTGGIVQGMSGSPIIKDGVLVGAVTHVLISDPTRGYGIFADNMIAAIPKTLA